MLYENKHLVLFTAEFPYGNKSETFLETEVRFLSQHFSSVIIVPSTKSAFIRDTPENVKVNDVLTSLNLSKSSKIKMLLSHFFLVFKLLSNEIKHKGIKKVVKHFNEYLDYIAQQLIKSKSICLIHEIKQHNSVIYDYWFQNSTLALAILKDQNKLTEFVSRGHGYDIYDERNPTTGVKFRHWIMKRIKKVYIISNFGADYFRSKINQNLHDKIRVSKLGIDKPVTETRNDKLDKTVIVSCASMLPFKQVEKIPIILSKVNKPIHWVHFGDGPSKAIVEANCQDLPKHISFELKGHVNNTEVIKYYQSNKVDLFLSLSTSEGLPVSMMEAQSFGIPILAYPIGGIPELVIPGLTGSLFQVQANNEQLRLELIKTIDTNFKHSEIVSFFENNFNAQVNYPNFINELCSSEK